MIWKKTDIVEKIEQLHRDGQDLSYNAMCRTDQSLVSAATYHFGSYRKAVQKAGVDYADVTRRPRWTKARVIDLIKQARRDNQDLHWSAVTRRRDELGKAAFACLQERLFGTWDRALQAAGLDPDEISLYRSWDEESILYELRSLSREGKPMNSGSLQQEDPGLLAAAMRRFGSYDAALLAAKLDPEQIRRRRRWSPEAVIRELKDAKRSGASLSGSAVRRDNVALYGAASRLFGTFGKAREAAGIKWKRGK